jgi:hypothetical protein
VVKPETNLRQGDQMLENTRGGTEIHSFIEHKLQKMGFVPREKPPKPA